MKTKAKIWVILSDTGGDGRFRDAGVDLTLASPKGGQPPVDPKSDLPENQTDAMARFKQDPLAQKALARSQDIRRSSLEHDQALIMGAPQVDTETQ